MLSPTSEVQSGDLARLVARLVELGVPSDVADFDRLEVVANVVMVLPAGALAVLAFPRPRWQDWAAYGFLVALAVELVQGLALPAREASAVDVVANTLGVLLGAGAVSLVVRRRRRG